MLALALGTVLAVSALVFVLYPLFVEPARTPARPGSAASQARKESEAVAALREIEFDRETGKLSQADYDELRTRYTQRALEEMRQSDSLASATPDDALERVIAEYRTHLKECVRCGPRPEADALYCSNCGSYLPGQCAACGAPVTESGAGYCTGCGRSLAA